MDPSPSLKYVCISDLHLGAEYSVLTRIDPKETNFFIKLPDTPSQTLVQFSASLRALMDDMVGGEELPTLVLMGDVLDLSFSSLPDASRTFATFIRELFPKDSARVFANKIILLPGNHDHHLWKSIKDRWFQNEVREKIPSELMEVTNLFDTPSFGSVVLNNLLHSIDGYEDMEVVAAYPNLGDKTAERCLVLHHGHFIESTYRIMSLIAGWFLQQKQDASAYDLEQQNGAWIDFLWSSFGSEGAVGKTGVDLYSTLNDPAAAHELIERMAKSTLGFLSSSMPIGSGPISSELPGITYEGVLTGVYDLTWGKAAESERSSYYSVLSKSGVTGLRGYLATTVLNQLREHDHQHKETTFVFGHTHKPFQDRSIIAGYKNPVNIFNSGGWVLDNPAMTSTQGAALIFIDSELQAASLRLFNDPEGVRDNEVHAAGVGGYPDKANKMLLRLKHALIPQKWKDFETAFEEGIILRAEIARRRFFNPASNPDLHRQI